MLTRQPQLQTLFTVPKRTGTPGDDLVAWGLAIVVSEIAGQDIVLRDDGPSFSIASSMQRDELLERVKRHEPTQDMRLPWLGSTEKGRVPSEEIDWVDRDTLRDDYARLREAQRSGADVPSDGDAPAAVVSDPRAWKYPLYRPLTNPGTQWKGYNGFAEIVQQKLLSPEGLALVLSTYRVGEPIDDAELDKAFKDLGIGKKGERWRNPPGFLYPGLNKGPTMRLRDAHGGSIGPSGAADWRMADRNDRSVVELYLAYVGYFAVSRIQDSRDGRITFVPAPGIVQVPAGLGALGSVAMPYSELDDYLLARASLAYGDAALRYLDAFRPDEVDRYSMARLVLRGVHVCFYWMPSGNTYSPRRVGFAPVPAWFPNLLSSSGYQGVRETIELHARQLSAMRGRWRDERRLSGERRDALTAYTASLNGGMHEWLRAIDTWFPAIRTAKADDWIGLWRTDEIGRILMALDPKSDLLEIIEHESFQKMAAAIRAATVYAHLSRMERRRGGGVQEQGYDPEYDLVATLSGSADRGPSEFLRELFEFAARFNDETLRRNERVPPRDRRAMLRTDDLDQLKQWVLADRRGIVATALLAYGSSLPPKRSPEDESLPDASELEPTTVASDGEGPAEV